MSENVENELSKIPVVNWLIRLLKKIKLIGFKGLSLYDLLEMYAIGIIKGALTSRAGAIAFSLFMALFPLMIFLITLLPFVIPYVPVDDFDREFLYFLESFLPSATSEYFSDIFEQIKNQKQGGLLSSTFLLSIFLIANGVNAILSGFENSYHVNLTRNFFRQYIYAFIIGLALALLLIFTAVLYIYFEIYIGDYLSELAGKTAEVDTAVTDLIMVQITKILFFILLTYFTTATLYYFGTKEGRIAKFFSVGAVMTTLLFLLTSYLFGIYIEKFARYNELYGALGGLLILMVYIWLNSNILLLGFELNASLNKFRKKN